MVRTYKPSLCLLLLLSAVLIAGHESLASERPEPQHIKEIEALSRKIDIHLTSVPVRLHRALGHLKKLKPLSPSVYSKKILKISQIYISQDKVYNRLSQIDEASFSRFLFSLGEQISYEDALLIATQIGVSTDKPKLIIALADSLMHNNQFEVYSDFFQKHSSSLLKISPYSWYRYCSATTLLGKWYQCLQYFKKIPQQDKTVAKAFLLLHHVQTANVSSAKKILQSLKPYKPYCSRLNAEKPFKGMIAAAVAKLYLLEGNYKKAKECVTQQINADGNLNRLFYTRHLELNLSSINNFEDYKEKLSQLKKASEQVEQSKYFQLLYALEELKFKILSNAPSTSTALLEAEQLLAKTKYSSYKSYLEKLKKYSKSKQWPESPDLKLFEDAFFKQSLRLLK